MTMTKPTSEQVTFTAAGSGATLRNLVDKVREVVSVKDFGAVGDGVTDDTAAFQAAVNAHECVYIPEGNYLIDSYVVLRAHSKVFGAGMSATRIIAPNVRASYPQGVFHASSPSLATQLDGIELSDMELDGLVSTLGFSEQRALVQFSGVRDCIVQRVKFSGFRGDGIMVDSTNVNLAVRNNTNVTIRDCVFDGVNYENRNGISIITGDGIHILNNTFRNVSRSNMPGPIDVEPNNPNEVVRNINIIGNTIESFGGNAAMQVLITSAASPRVTPVYGVNMSGNYIANNALAGAAGILARLEGSAGLVTRSSEPHALRICDNTFRCEVAQLMKPILVWRVRGAEIHRNTCINGSVTGIGDQQELAVSAIDVSFCDNMLYRNGNVDGALVIGSVSNVRISGNTFDSPRDGTGTIAIGINGSSVTTTSELVAITDNTFIKGASQTTAVRVLSHTQDAATNTYSGNRFIGGALGSSFEADYGEGERYEEGTWTPEYVSSSGSFATMTMDVISATYTRTGDQVTVRAWMRTDNVDATGATGNLRISGMPFVPLANSLSSVSVGSAKNFAASNFPSGGYTLSASPVIQLTQRSAADGTTNESAPSALVTGATANQNELVFTATYFV